MNETAIKKPCPLVPAEEEALVVRRVLAWINRSPLLPSGAVRYELLDAGYPNMCMALTSDTRKVAQYILGGYRAELRFGIVYRIQPGDSGAARLSAEEQLSSLADWCCDSDNLPELDGRCIATGVSCDGRARMRSAFETGDEDYAINLIMTYEVMN